MKGAIKTQHPERAFEIRPAALYNGSKWLRPDKEFFMKQNSALKQALFRYHAFSLTHPILAPALAASLVLALVWTVVWIVVPLAPFGDYTLCTNDGFAQYMPFLSMLRRTLYGQGSFLYSFDGGLGGNFYLTIAYYLFSPFSLLAALFAPQHIPAAANLIIVLKNILVGAIMAGWLGSKKTAHSSLLCAACGAGYALGYYFMGYAVNFMWMDSIAILPMILYGMEHLGSRKGRLIYLFSLAYAILCNFYMGAILCLFLALYYFVMLFRIDRNGWRRFFWFTYCSIAAALLAGIVLMPVVFGMLGANSSRMSVPELEVFNDAKYILSRFLPDADVVRITHNRGTLNVYTGTISCFLLAVFILQKAPKGKLRRKYGLLFLWALYLVSTQVSWLNYAFHGFYLQRQVPNRFGFLIGFLGFVMAFLALCRIRKTKRWKLLAAAAASIGFFVSAILIGDLENWWLIPVLCAVLIAAFVAAWLRRPKLLAAMMLVECMGGAAMCAPGTLGASYTDMELYLRAAAPAKGKRSEILATNIVNAPSLYGLRGLSAFNSVINPDTAGFLGKLGFASGENYYRYFGHTPITSLLTGMEQVITYQGTMLPYPWVHTSNLESLAIWENSFDIPIGLCGLDENANFSSKNEFENIAALFPGTFETVPVSAHAESDSTIESEGENSWSVSEIQEDDQTTLTLEPMEGKDLYVFGSMSGTGKYTVTKNDTTLEDNSYEGNIVWLGDVNPDDRIVVTFEAENDRDSSTARLYAARLDPSNTARVIGGLQGAGLQNETVEGNRITGSRHSETDEKMVFTIPFDEGWSARVDGKPVEIEAFQNALVQIPLSAGDHSIELIFIPPGLYAGVAMSLAGVLATLVIIALPSHPKRARQTE